MAFIIATYMLSASPGLMPKLRTEEVTIGMINELHLKVAKGKILSKFEKLCSQILKMNYESIGT